MPRANNKPVSRKRKPPRFQYKKDLRNDLGDTVDQLHRCQQRLKEAEKKAEEVPKLKREVRIRREIIQALVKQNQKMQQHLIEAEKKKAFPQTTVSTQTAVVVQQELEIRSIFSSSENANPLIQNPPVQRINDKELGEALKTLPNEVQNQLHMEARSFATQIRQGKKIPAQLWIMNQLIEYWLNYGKK
uniref:Uncharacterized protein n=1 Tax=Panagrolaimus sp. PS1159 TaxID=55785 RepID=A0AC35FCT9_9BILA